MARSEKVGGLTGSSRVKSKRKASPDKSGLEKLQETTKAVADVVGGAVDAAQMVNNTAKQVRRGFGGGSGLVSGDRMGAINQAQDLAGTYGLELQDISQIISSSNFDVDDSIPEMDAKTANQLTLRIERQNNALEVEQKRIDQKRKIVRNHRSQWNLVGDLVELDTTRIEVGTKVVNHEIANSKFQQQQSKLEEQEELLEQQVIRTQGVISLTEGIRKEWDLRFQKQERQLEKLEIEIEQANNDNLRQREKLESFLFE